MDIQIAGHKTYAHTGGKPFEGDAPVLVLVHGAGMDHTVWQLQTRYFAHHGRRVLAVDLPGHGRSDGMPVDSIAGIADWLIALLDALGVEKAALAGHSLGALAAVDCAARYPDRVSALALLGCAPKMPVHPDLLAAAQNGDHLAFDLVTVWGYGRPAHLGGHRAPGVWMTQGGTRLLEAGPNGALGIDLAAANAYQDGLARAAEVTCPAILICGDGDKMTPVKGAKQMHDVMADADIEIIPRAGHMMMIEKPDAALDAMKRVV